MIFKYLVVLFCAIILAVAAQPSIEEPTGGAIVATCEYLQIVFTVDDDAPAHVIFGRKMIGPSFLVTPGANNTVSFKLPCCLKTGYYPITIAQGAEFSDPVQVYVVNGCSSSCSSRC